MRSLLYIILSLLVLGVLSVQVEKCDITILGGSTAALGAAISSAQALIQHGASSSRVCLIEPTDWVGGQLTASAVPAIDFAWHVIKDPITNQTLNVAQIDRDPSNITPLFLKWLKTVGDPGKCWVSNYCYAPKDLLALIGPVLKSLAPTLSVFFETVPLSVVTDGNRIVSMDTVHRTAMPGVQCNGYDHFLSQDIDDWYSSSPSSRFSKSMIRFESSMFVDASEWGELLTLSGSPYLQGISELYDGDVSGNGDDQCGQSMALDFTELVNPAPVVEPPNPFPDKYADFYSLLGYTWQKVFTYRRMLGNAADWNVVSNGDVTLQNWAQCNDYKYGYAFIPRNVRDDHWRGGVNVEVLKNQEIMAMGCHYWFKNVTSLGNRLTLDKSKLGTCTGMAKIPYMRDTKRSIGIDGFLLNITSISGTVAQQQGTRWYDTIAIGSYNVDVHGVLGCKYPDYMAKHYDILPFSLPYRAHTNVKFENLWVAGKTIAQSFLVNSATRLHPVEFASGTGLGAVLAYGHSHNIHDSRKLMNVIGDAIVWVCNVWYGGDDVQVKNFTPVTWTINK